MTEYILDRGGDAVIDYAQPGDVYRVVGPHRRLRVRHGGAFDAPEFEVVGENATFEVDDGSHNILNCKNLTLRNLTFYNKMYIRDDPDTDHHSGGLRVENCQVIRPNTGGQALKITPAPGVLIDGIHIRDCIFSGGDVYLGEPHWNDQPDDEKKEIANVVFECNVVRNAREGVQFKGAIGVRCAHNECFDLDGGGLGIYEAAYLVDDGTRDVLIAWNKAKRCTGNGVHVVPGEPDDTVIMCNKFIDCASAPFENYPGVIYVSQRQGVKVLHNTVDSGSIHFTNRVNWATVQGNALLAGSVRADFPTGNNYTSETLDISLWGADLRPLADVPGDVCEQLTLDLDDVEYNQLAPTMGCYQFVPGARFWTIRWDRGVMTVQSDIEPTVGSPA